MEENYSEKVENFGETLFSSMEELRVRFPGDEEQIKMTIREILKEICVDFIKFQGQPRDPGMKFQRWEDIQGVKLLLEFGLGVIRVDYISQLTFRVTFCTHEQDERKAIKMWFSSDYPDGPHKYQVFN